MPLKQKAPRKLLGAGAKEWVVHEMKLSFFARCFIILLTSFGFLFAACFPVKNTSFQAEMCLATTLTFPPALNVFPFHGGHAFPTFLLSEVLTKLIESM